MPTEMFCISLNPSDGAKANINIKAEGQNEHHKIEAIFKVCQSDKSCRKRDTEKMILPSTKERKVLSFQVSTIIET
jgi:imidazoleglycerol-phosphate dehydratase/histidinol-phosphatase